MSTITREKDFGDKIVFDFPKRSYDKAAMSFSLYVTGMNEVSATSSAGKGDYHSWFFSADDLLVLRDWVDSQIVPAKAAIRNKYAESIEKKTCDCRCKCC